MITNFENKLKKIYSIIRNQLGLLKNSKWKSDHELKFQILILKKKLQCKSQT